MTEIPSGDGNSSYLQKLEQIQQRDQKIQLGAAALKSQADTFHLMIQAMLASSAQVANSGR